MRLLPNTFSVIIRGDWCKTYAIPDWLFRNVFETVDSVEVGVTVDGMNSSARITFRCNGVELEPGSDKVQFTVNDPKPEMMTYLATYFNRYMERATTPRINAYGFNVDYGEKDSSVFADVSDNLKDRTHIIRSGYQIDSTEIRRKLVHDDGTIINSQMRQEGDRVIAHFNEHHELPQQGPVNIRPEDLTAFIDRCSALLCAMGYRMEE